MLLVLPLAIPVRAQTRIILPDFSKSNGFKWSSEKNKDRVTIRRANRGFEPGKRTAFSGQQKVEEVAVLLKGGSPAVASAATRGPHLLQPAS